MLETELQPALGFSEDLLEIAAARAGQRGKRARRSAVPASSPASRRYAKG
jgi:hypothetical protein